MFNLQNKLLHRFILIIVLFIGLTACNSRPKGVINEKDMTSILTEMHKLDGIILEKGFQYGNTVEKQQYYLYILKKYDVTQAEFDSSLVWYNKNPKKFEVIYDNVLLKLTDFENEVKSNKYHPIDSVELAKRKDDVWDKNRNYQFTKDSVRTHLDFEIKNSNFLLGDVYVLKFLQRIAPEDSCKNPHVVLRINYANGKKDSAYAITHNDSLLRRFSLRLPALRKLKIKSISGSLLGSKAYKGKFNATLDSIVLLRQYNTRFQDSLRNVVKKNEIVK
jgi:hypothetical protein